MREIDLWNHLRRVGGEGEAVSRELSIHLVLLLAWGIVSTCRMVASMTTILLDSFFQSC